VTHDAIVVFAALGVAGQAAAASLLVVAGLAAVGFRRPLALVRSALWGYELWLAFLVTALATGGSLFFSEIANFVPCELCWFERICMYPLAVVTLLAALANDHRAARYLLPLPLVGAGLAVYHMLIEEGAVSQTKACLVSAPGGCATKWIEEFGWVTIPNLTLTAFVLALAFLLFASVEAKEAR
jgi:disulfide bond formation protein DsbB